MSDHLSPELEALIVDALAGDLDETSRARLDAAIAADPTIADLLGEQVEVSGSLSSDVAGLTELESARLRRDVLDAVAPAPADSTVPVTRPWVRWAFSAAAVLVLVVGGIGFLTQGGGDDALVESAEPILESQADDVGDDEAFSAGADAAESAEESTDMADTDLAAVEGDGATDDAIAGELAPRAAALACNGEAIALAQPLAFETLDDAITALGEEARGSFDPRGLESLVAPDGDGFLVTWLDAGGEAYQAGLETTPDGWSVLALVVCDR